MTKAVFQLEDLTCPSCVKKIETTLSKAEGVSTVKVLFASSKVRVELDEAKIGVNQLEEMLSNLGYPVLSAKTKEL